MGVINRIAWIDDDGSRLVGTPINNEQIQTLQDRIDDEIASPEKPNVTVWSIINNVIAGVPFDFGGSPNAWTPNSTYATGAGYDPDTIIAPFSRVWKVDPALLQGTFFLEAILRTDNAAQAASLALVNMTSAPNTPIAEISSTSTTGQLVRSAGFTFPAGGAEVEYAVKLKTATADVAQANAWGIRVFRGN